MTESIQDPENSIPHDSQIKPPETSDPTTTTEGGAAITPNHSQSFTCTCGNSINATKRSSPTKDSSEPKPKKLFVEQNACNRNGFFNTSFPNCFTKTQTYPILRRCFSDPNNPPSAQLLPGSGSPENMKMISNATTPSPSKGSNSASRLPPLPPAVNRSGSDLSPYPAKSYSRSSSFGDADGEGTPNSKKIRKVLDGMKELIRMWDEVLPPDESYADCAAPEEHSNAKEDEYVTDDAEFVSVEKSGDGLIIHFNCQCSKVYQILLSGSSCYYKLNAD